MKHQLTTIPEIKAAVDRGEIVYVASDSYKVIKDSIGQYLIKCGFNDYCIGLHGQEGTKYANKLNGTNFYIKIGE